MKLLPLLLIITLCSSPAAFGQKVVKDQQPSTVQDFKFKGIFGFTPKDSSAVYCLLGLGYFLAPKSDDIDAHIAEWIKDHPNAIVKPVYTSGPVFSDESGSSNTYCWIIDKDDNLNLWLVKKGYVGGQNMQYPTEQIKKQLGMDIVDEEMIEKVHVTEAEYQQFIALVREAALYAQEKKLGIWKDK